jgi:hypothetical protein
MISLSNIYTTTAILPPRIIVHGREGSGKTTLAAQFPGPIFLQRDTSRDSIRSVVVEDVSRD